MSHDPKHPDKLAAAQVPDGPQYLKFAYEGGLKGGKEGGYNGAVKGGIIAGLIGAVITLTVSLICRYVLGM